MKAFVVTVYILATVGASAALAVNGSPYLAFWLALLLLGSVSVK